MGKVYKIPKAGSKVKVFTRAHSNKMGERIHFFTQTEGNFCNLSAQGVWRQTASEGSKRDKAIPRQDSHQQTRWGTGRGVNNPFSAAAGGTQGTQTAGQPEPPASGCSLTGHSGTCPPQADAAVLPMCDTSVPWLSCDS